MLLNLTTNHSLRQTNHPYIKILLNKPLRWAHALQYYTQYDLRSSFCPIMCFKCSLSTIPRQSTNFIGKIPQQLRLKVSQSRSHKNKTRREVIHGESRFSMSRGTTYRKYHWLYGTKHDPYMYQYLVHTLKWQALFMFLSQLGRWDDLSGPVYTCQKLHKKKRKEKKEKTMQTETRTNYKSVRFNDGIIGSSIGSILKIHSVRHTRASTLFNPNS